MIRIVTDSTSCISKEEAKQYDVDIVSLYVLINGKTYKDGIDIEINEFYQLLKDSQPSTSQPTPSDFIEVFAKYPDDEILCITLSDKLSGTYQGAVLAKKILERDNIKIFNSENVALGLRTIVLKAISLKNKGLSIEKIIEKIEILKNKVVIYGMVDTLENLKRGGRISHLKFLAGTLLKLKPIIMIKDGILKDSGKKVRGIKKALTIMANLPIENNCDENYPINIGYSCINENAKLLYEKLNAMNIYKQKETYFEIGSVLAAHTAENAIVISFVKK